MTIHLRNKESPKICGTNIAAQGRAMQVLQEYFVTVTQKLGFNPREARRKVEILSEFDVATAGVGDILGAIDLHRLHQFSFRMR
jgi:hypothetical protein